MDSRVPSHDLDAEAAVLSAALLDAAAARLIVEALTPESFYSNANRRVFEAIRELRGRDAPVDVVTVGDELKTKNRIADVGGVPYLAYLVDAVPFVANLDSYVAIVLARAQQRAVTAFCQRAAAEGYGDVGDVTEWSTRVATGVAEISRSRRGGTSAHLSDALASTVRQLIATGEAGGMLGTTSGFPDLDALTSGFHPGDLVIVAGRPGMGKTSLVAAMCVAAARADGPAQCGSLVFSLEMPTEQIALRMLCAEAGVSISDLRSGKIPLDSPRWADLRASINELKNMPIYIGDTGASLADIAAEARRVKVEVEREPAAGGWRRRLAFVAVDYVSLVKVEARKNGNRQEEVAATSIGLKALAKELGVCVVALQQLNRKVEERPDKRPVLSDLRETGQIEQDADLILFVYRDEYYHAKGKMKDGRSNEGIAEIIIGKQRNGPTGTVEVGFHGPTTHFSPLDAARKARKEWGA